MNVLHSSQSRKRRAGIADFLAFQIREIRNRRVRPRHDHIIVALTAVESLQSDAGGLRWRIWSPNVPGDAPTRDNADTRA
jgi:hypothetical protein